MPQDFFQRPRRRFGEKDLSPLIGPARTLERVTQYIQRQSEDEAIRESLGQIQRVRARNAGLPPHLQQDAAEELPALGVLATRGGARGQALLGAVSSTRPKQDMTMTDAELTVAASQYGEPYESALKRRQTPAKPERLFQPSGRTEKVGPREYEIEEEIERGLGPTGFRKRGKEVTQPSDLDAALKESLLRQRQQAPEHQEETEARKMQDQLDQVESAIDQYEKNYGELLTEWTQKLKKDTPSLLAIATDLSLTEQERSQQLVATLGQINDPVLRNKLSIVSNYLNAVAKRGGLVRSLERRGKKRPEQGNDRRQRAKQLLKEQGYDPNDVDTFLKNNPNFK